MTLLVSLLSLLHTPPSKLEQRCSHECSIRMDRWSATLLPPSPVWSTRGNRDLGNPIGAQHRTQVNCQSQSRVIGLLFLIFGGCECVQVKWDLPHGLFPVDGCTSQDATGVAQPGSLCRGRTTAILGLKARGRCFFTTRVLRASYGGHGGFRDRWGVADQPIQPVAREREGEWARREGREGAVEAEARNFSKMGTGTILAPGLGTGMRPSSVGLILILPNGTISLVAWPESQGRRKWIG